MLRKAAVLLCVLFLALSAASQTVTPPNPLDLLKHSLERTSQSVSADWGIYIKSLDTGEEIAINADSVMDTMSVIKVPLLVDAYRQVDAGKINPADRITMATADKRFGTGVLRTLNDGLNLTVHDALTLMVIQSDNTATDMMFSRVGGPQHVNQTMRQMGFTTINAVGTSFDWFRALGEAGDPAWAKLTPEELFKRGFPQKNQITLTVACCFNNSLGDDIAQDLRLAGVIKFLAGSVKSFTHRRKRLGVKRPRRYEGMD